jgi:chemotaxis protein CheC
LLHVRVAFSVPHLYIEKIDDLLRSLTPDVEQRYALMVSTAFRIKGAEVHGYLVVILSISSLDRLIHEVDDWDSKQTRSH